MPNLPLSKHTQRTFPPRDISLNIRREEIALVAHDHALLAVRLPLRRHTVQLR